MILKQTLTLKNDVSTTSSCHCHVDLDKLGHEVECKGLL